MKFVIGPRKATLDQFSVTDATRKLIESVQVSPSDILLLSLDKNRDFFISKMRSICEADICRICGRSRSHGSHVSSHEFVEPERFHTDSVRYFSHGGVSSAGISGWTPFLECKKGQGAENRSIAVTDRSVLLMDYIFRQNYVLFEDEDSHLLWRYYTTKFTVDYLRVEMIGSWKINQQKPLPPSDYIPHEDNPLSDYQIAALNFSLERSNALFMEQGTGKTAVTVNRINLEAIRKRRKKDEMYRALVICPKNLRLNWQNEFEKFSVAPGKFVRLSGGSAERNRRLIQAVRPDPNCFWSVAAVGIDALEDFILLPDKTKGAFLRIPWDLIVIDESHYIKNHASDRARYCHAITKEGNSVNRMILTGTPVGNSMMDLWSQLEFLETGASGFRSMERFKNFYGQYDKQLHDGRQKLIGYENLPVLHETMVRLAVTISKEEAGLQLPPKIYEVIEVQMTKRQQKLYDSLEGELIAKIESLLSDAESKVTADHALTLLLRLAQITSGFVKFDAVEDPVTFAEILKARNEQIDEVNPKLETLVQLLQDENRDPNGKTIIWCLFREDVRVISKRLTELGISHAGYHEEVIGRCSDASAAVSRFNQEETCRVFLGTPQSAAEGHNMVGFATEDQKTATDHMIFFSRGWSLFHQLQAEDRAHRRTARKQLRITDLIVPKTIDEEIRSRVLSKKKNAASIQDVRETLKRLSEMRNS